MNDKDYIENVLKTESCDFDAMRNRITDDEDLRAIHAVMGISTEAGELLDGIKKFVFYGKNIDIINIEEELGDLMYYTALLVDCYGLNFDKIREKNIAKLRQRYGDKFSSDKAINRELDKERAILETK